MRYKVDLTDDKGENILILTVVEGKVVLGGKGGGKRKGKLIDSEGLIVCYLLLSVDETMSG